MTAAEYLERVRAAATNDAAHAVTREAFADAQDGRITVDEWNAVWLEYDRRTRSYRYQQGSEWTGD